MEKPVNQNEEQPRLATARESLRAARKTQHSQKQNKIAFQEQSGL